jgi:flagellar hook-length control protein FliK
MQPGPLPLDLAAALAPVAAPPAGGDPAAGDLAAAFDVLLGALQVPRDAQPPRDRSEQAASDLDPASTAPASVEEAPQAVARDLPANVPIELSELTPPAELEGSAPAAPEPSAESPRTPANPPEPQAFGLIRAASLVNLILGTAEGLRAAPARPEPPADSSAAEEPPQTRSSIDASEPRTPAARREQPELTPALARSESLDLPESGRGSGARSAPAQHRERAAEPETLAPAARPIETRAVDPAGAAAPESAAPHAAARASAASQPAPALDASAPAPVADPAAAREANGASAARALPELPAHGEVEVVRSVRVLAEQGGGRVTIRLDPPELGGLSLRVVVSDGAVHVSLLADQAPVADLLQRHSADLRSALESHGLRLDRLDVGAGDVDLGSRDAHPREPEERGAAGARAPFRQPLAASFAPRRFDVSTLGAVDLHV